MVRTDIFDTCIPQKRNNHIDRKMKFDGKDTYCNPYNDMIRGLHPMDYPRLHLKNKYRSEKMGKKYKSKSNDRLPGSSPSLASKEIGEKCGISKFASPREIEIPITVIKRDLNKEKDLDKENTNHEYTKDRWYRRNTKICNGLNDDSNFYESHMPDLWNDIINSCTYTAPTNLQDHDVINLEDLFMDLVEEDDDCKALSQKPWVKSLNLTMKDRMELIEGSMLSDKHIYAAQKLLHKQFPNIAGLQDPCVSQIGFSPVKDPSIQIHHNRGSHWVLSSSLDGTVKVYDSLYHSISSDMQVQLQDIYVNHIDNKTGFVDSELVDTQKQLGISDCALFAIAWAYELCSGREPENVCLLQSKLRSHLLDCFESEKLCSFPKKVECDQEVPGIEC